MSGLSWVDIGWQIVKLVGSSSINLDVIFALIKLPRIYEIGKPTYVGGKREEEKLSMLPEDINYFSP